MNRPACILSLLGCLLFLQSQAAIAGADTAMGFKLSLDSQGEKLYRKVSGESLKVYAKGTITAGTGLRLLDFLKLNHITEPVTLVFNSPGGSLTEGMTLGHIVRSLGFNTAIGELGRDYDFKDSQTSVRAVCASACVYAFAGGVLREHRYPDTLLGVHQFYSADKNNIGDIGDIQKVSASVLAYLSEMGIDSRAFQIASQASRNAMIWITPAESAALNLAFDGVEKTTSEIKLVGSTPYLRLQQNREAATARIMFTCEKEAINLIAGIVTNEKNTSELALWNRSYYVELSDQTRFHGKSLTPAQSAIWVQLDPLTAENRRAILRSDILNIWLENGGPFRRGAEMDITQVKAKIEDFFNNCLQ